MILLLGNTGVVGCEVEEVVVVVEVVGCEVEEVVVVVEVVGCEVEEVVVVVEVVGCEVDKVLVVKYVDMVGCEVEVVCSVVLEGEGLVVNIVDVFSVGIECRTVAVAVGGLVSVLGCDVVAVGEMVSG